MVKRIMLVTVAYKLFTLWAGSIPVRWLSVTSSAVSWHHFCLLSLRPKWQVKTYFFTYVGTFSLWRNRDCNNLRDRWPSRDNWNCHKKIKTLSATPRGKVGVDNYYKKRFFKIVTIIISWLIFLLAKHAESFLFFDNVFAQQYYIISRPFFVNDSSKLTAYLHIVELTH